MKRAVSEKLSSSITRFNSTTHKELDSYSLGQVYVSYSHHAKEQSERKSVATPAALTVLKGSIVEAELDSRNKVTKLVVRVSQCSEWDAVYVIVPQGNSRLTSGSPQRANASCWFVLTCWLNHVSDTHRTLRKERLSA